MKSTTAFRIAAGMGFLGVVLGALGAHGGLHDVLVKNNTEDIWKTASSYHLIHAVALLFLATLRPMPKAAWVLIFSGVIMFSGSLYLLASKDLHWLGPVTPVGGVALLAGWAALALRKMTKDE
jgi:uncharacterized membrane protein YgdD (TMEM256/DUF423 family)